MTRFASVLTLLLVAAVPVSAQTMGTLLPTLTWPEGDVTTSTKGCEATKGAETCTLQE